MNVRGESIILYTQKYLRITQSGQSIGQPKKKIINKEKWQWGRFERNFGIDHYYNQGKKECHLFSFCMNVILIYIEPFIEFLGQDYKSLHYG